MTQNVKKGVILAGHTPSYSTPQAYSPLCCDGSLAWESLELSLRYPPAKTLISARN